MPPLQSATPVIKYDMDVDGFAGEVWDNPPNWVKDKARNSKQYQELAPDTVLPAPSEEEEKNPADKNPPDKRKICLRRKKRRRVRFDISQSRQFFAWERLHSRRRRNESVAGMRLTAR